MHLEWPRIIRWKHISDDLCNVNRASCSSLQCCILLSKKHWYPKRVCKECVDNVALKYTSYLHIKKGTFYRPLWHVFQQWIIDDYWLHITSTASCRTVNCEPQTARYPTPVDFLLVREALPGCLSKDFRGSHNNKQMCYEICSAEKHLVPFTINILSQRSQREQERRELKGNFVLTAFLLHRQHFCGSIRPRTHIHKFCIYINAQHRIYTANMTPWFHFNLCNLIIQMYHYYYQQQR